jgi:hypothetical protein
MSCRKSFIFCGSHCTPMAHGQPDQAVNADSGSPQAREGSRDGKKSLEMRCTLHDVQCGRVRS